VEDHLQKLIAEYCAIEKMDRIVRSADQRNETELIGLRVRELRRREILLELTKWIIAPKNIVPRHDERDPRTQDFDSIETRNVSHENR
jgi:hypothetical protein